MPRSRRAGPTAIQPRSVSNREPRPPPKLRHSRACPANPYAREREDMHRASGRSRAALRANHGIHRAHGRSQERSGESRDQRQTGRAHVHGAFRVLCVFRGSAKRDLTTQDRAIRELHVSPLRVVHVRIPTVPKPSPQLRSFPRRREPRRRLTSALGGRRNMFVSGIWCPGI